MTAYDGMELAKRPANFQPLSPVSMLKRTAQVYPGRTAQIHGRIRRSWAEVGERCRRLASALEGRGVEKGDTVAVLAPNIPEAFECAFAVPMLGAVLNTNNTRLDAATIAYILDHGEAKALLVDTELSERAKAAVAEYGRDILVSTSRTARARAATESARSRMTSCWQKATRTSDTACLTMNGMPLH